MSQSSDEALLGEYTLARKQSTTQRWTFALNDDDTYLDFTEWDAYGEIRTKEKGGELLVSLTAHLSVLDGSSPTVVGKYLVLLLPGSADVAVEYPPKDGWFDIFLVNKVDASVDQLLVQGPATFDDATTDMREALT